MVYVYKYGPINGTLLWERGYIIETFKTEGVVQPDLSSFSKIFIHMITLLTWCSCLVSDTE